MIHRLIFIVALFVSASCLAAPLDKRIIGKWHEPGQREACKLGAIRIKAKSFAGCTLVTASTPEVNKYNDGGLTQYIAVDCAADSGTETSFYWLHLSSHETGSYGRVGVGGKRIIHRCPKTP